ncbi:EAL domain-containing protein [Guyparkeria halophila]|uniref:EAL domain-containing protein n=1 Tax=Guyparkeria halophila TaxID=47960 RepID=UPI001E5103FF|nr:EAL domain-containing protein [Guyparkeria halophila]
MNASQLDFDPKIVDILPPGREVLTCPPDTPVFEAAGLMRAAGVSSIVVTDADGPVGIWTEHDALALDLSSSSVFDRPVRTVMSSPVRSIPSTATLTDAAHLFRERHIRHLLVGEGGDGQAALRGIISLTDVVLNQGIEHYLHFRTVGTLVGQESVVIRETDTLSQASRRMREARVDAVLVALDEGGHGILTERDLVGLIANRHEDVAVGGVCTRELFTVPADASLFHVRRMMNERGVRHIGVERDGDVEGLVSFADLLSGIELAYVDELRSALQARDSALASSERNLQLAEKVIQTSLEGIMITDAKGRIMRVNPAFTDLTGYRPEEVIGHSPAVLQSGRHDKAFYDRMWATLNRDGQWRGEIWNRRKNGEIYPELLTIKAITDEDGAISHYAALFSDITELKENERQIRHLAYYDPLTGLPNRRLFHDRLDLAIAHAHRSGGRLAVLFIDLDHFKKINDTLGHAVGDELLEVVAGKLTACLREDDSVARTGGDEFLALLPEIEDFEPVADIAQRIIDSLSQPVVLEGRELVIGCSVGVAFYPDDGEDSEALLKHADIAMYRAKQSGRNTYSLFTPAMNEAARRRLDLESGLRQAIEQGQFRLHYQPVVDQAGELVGAEALLRWDHPEWGAIGPGEFIPLAEETGLILPIGEQVVREAVRQSALWGARVKMSVNLSARQFADPDLARSLIDTCESMGVTGAAMTLEITETALMQDVDAHVATMNELREAGFRFSIDDFGTGYSSLAYLRRFPLDCLKIDRGFTAEMIASSDAREIVSATIALAHNLRLRVIAEGVETVEQARLLAELGADLQQGYYHGRPMPAEAFARHWGLGQPARRAD